MRKYLGQICSPITHQYDVLIPCTLIFIEKSFQNTVISVITALLLHFSKLQVILSNVTTKKISKKKHIFVRHVSKFRIIYHQFIMATE